MAYDLLEVELIFEDLEDRITKSINSLNGELNNMRAGRANIHILDSVRVDYYGVESPLNQLANVTVPEARLIMVSVWDSSMLKKVEKAIVDANIGIMPNNDGKVLRLYFPEPTEERRKTLVKDVKNLAERTKVAIRNIRRDSIAQIKELEKSKTISEDLSKGYEADVDKKVTAKIADVDKISADKEKEILTV